MNTLDTFVILLLDVVLLDAALAHYSVMQDVYSLNMFSVNDLNKGIASKRLEIITTLVAFCRLHSITGLNIFLLNHFALPKER